MKRANLRILALLLVLCMGLCACRKNPADAPETDPSVNGSTGESAVYTVTVTDEAGSPVESVGVFVYEDETKAELVWFARTDAEGKVSFTCQSGASLVAFLSELPEGYTAEAQYAITGPETTIVLGGGPNAEGAWALGTVMPDFTFTDCEGNTYTLSQLLEEKEAVVLNFWYINCMPCKMEFPYLQEAYEQYSDAIALLAVNPMDQDNAAIAKYKAENNLTFPMGTVPAEWEKLMAIRGYPTTVIIDRTGVISLIHTGTIPDAKIFADAFDYFTALNYVPGVVEDINSLVKVDPSTQVGTKDKPVSFPGQMKFKLFVPANGENYFELTKLQNMYMQVKGEGISVISRDKTYQAKKGKVSLPVSCPDTFTPLVICVKNPTDKDQTVEVSLSYPSGTVNNPIPMKEGDTTVKLSAGKDQGIVYKFKAPESGELTVSCLGITPSKVKYDIILFNTSTNAMRNLSADGSEDADGNPCVTVKVKKGQTIQITVTALPDSSRKFPAATIKCRTTFVSGNGADIEEPVIPMTNYAVTVTDGERKPLSGVAFNVQTEKEVLRFVTGKDGIARMQLPTGTYQATLVVPAGYKASTTRFTLSEKIPMLAVKVDRNVVITEKYTVKVQNEDGKPLADVIVDLGGSFGFTDAKGIVSFTLPKGQYTAGVSIPAGYDDSVREFPFAKGKNSLTITLKKKQGGVEPGPDLTAYTITVKDYSGEPCKTALVQMYKNGSPAASKIVDAKGVAAFELEAGSYTVKLSFSGKTFYYEEIVVTESAPNATVRVAPALTGDPIHTYQGDAYYVSVGGSYVETQADIVNLFIFEPKVSGYYRFAVSDPNATISYWGGSTNYIRDMTDSEVVENYSGKSFNMNIKEGNLDGIVLLGVTGTDNTILEIERVSDPHLGEEDMEPIIYKPKTPPVDQTVKVPSGKRIKSVDLSAGTDSVKLVFNSGDGYYHWGKASGPVVYLNFDDPFLSLVDMTGANSSDGAPIFRKFFRDENGVAIRLEDYTSCLVDYAKKAYGNGQKSNCLYPLTEDLLYIMRNGGEEKGWWDPDSINFLFGDRPEVNLEIAYLFLCCTIE